MNQKNTKLATKIKAYRAIVFTSLVYGYETRTLYPSTLSVSTRMPCAQSNGRTKWWTWMSWTELDMPALRPWLLSVWTDPACYTRYHMEQTGAHVRRRWMLYTSLAASCLLTQCLRLCTSKMELASHTHVRRCHNWRYHRIDVLYTNRASLFMSTRPRVCAFRMELVSHTHVRRCLNWRYHQIDGQQTQIRSPNSW